MTLKKNSSPDFYWVSVRLVKKKTKILGQKKTVFVMFVPRVKVVPITPCFERQV